MYAIRSYYEAMTIEVDLHINQLVDSVIGMSNADIIQKQLEVFHKTMTDAILRKAGKVILIHGIGNGTLKAALRESLSVQYKLPYEDASFREYGFGATMVIFRITSYNVCYTKLLRIIIN